MTDTAPKFKFSTTVIVVLVFIIGLIAWTIYMQVTNGMTVSQVVYQINEIHPVFPFLAGFVCGHFWFPRTSK